MRDDLRLILYQRMPLFFLGSSFAAGVYSCLVPSMAPLFLFCALFCFFVVPIRHFFCLCLVLFLGILWAAHAVLLPPRDHPIRGVAICSLTNITPTLFHKKQNWRCEFWIHSFVDESGRTVAQGVRASYYSKKEWSLPEGERVRLNATLHMPKDFFFQLSRVQNIESVGHDFLSLTSFRRAVRDFLLQALSFLFPDKEISSLLGTLCFSLPCSQEMRKCIHKVGLDHVLGVSGFHFSQLTFWMALAAGYVNRWAFSCMAWMVLTLFFFIVGPLPAVFRAWISSTLCIGQRVVGRSPNGFNSLGLGLLCLTLYDPCSLGSLSLQLSFFATCALLAFFPFFDRILSRVLPHHSRESLLSFSVLDQLLASFLRLARASLAVGLSVSLVIIPYQLAYMSDFPLLGLPANLFLPHFFDLAFLATFALLILHVVFPLLSQSLAFLVNKWVQVLIHVVREAPSPSWGMVQNFPIPEYVASCIIALLLFGGACLRILSEYGKEDRSYEWMASI